MERENEMVRNQGSATNAVNIVYQLALMEKRI
jgi:hypothetical protein